MDTPVSLSHVRYPSAFGLSFSVAESTPGITVDVAAAQYEDKDGKWHRRQARASPLHISLGASGALPPITALRPSNCASWCANRDRSQTGHPRSGQHSTGARHRVYGTATPGTRWK